MLSPSISTRALPTGSLPVPSINWPPTIAVISAMSHLHGIEADMHQRLAAADDRAGMDRQHDAGMRAQRLAVWIAVQRGVSTDDAAHRDPLVAAHGALEQAATRRVDPGEVREVPKRAVVDHRTAQHAQVPHYVAEARHRVLDNRVGEGRGL